MDKHAHDRAAIQRMETFLHAMEKPQASLFRVTMWHLHIVQKNNWQKYMAALTRRITQA